MKNRKKLGWHFFLWHKKYVSGTVSQMRQFIAMSVDEHMLMFYVIYFKRISFFVYLSVLKLFDYTKTFLMPKNLSNPSALKPVLIFLQKE